MEVQRFIKALQGHTDPKFSKQELVDSMTRHNVTPPLSLAQAENPLNRIFKGYVSRQAETSEKLVPDPFADQARSAISPGQGGKSLLMEDQAFVIRDNNEENFLKALAAERIELRSQFK